MDTKNKLICLVGMPGSGKTEVSNYLSKKRDFGYFRFGQPVLDKVKESGQTSSEKLEREIREGLRREYGMAALAILNEKTIEMLLTKGHVLGDGLRSYEEYIYLKERFPESLKVIYVFTSPYIRYQRLTKRGERHGIDKNLKYRSFTLDEAVARDRAEIEGLHIGGTIAMADFTLLNTATKENLYTQIDKVLTEIFG